MQELGCSLIVDFLDVVADGDFGQVSDFDLICPKRDNLSSVDVISKTLARDILHARPRRFVKDLPSRCSEMQ